MAIWLGDDSVGVPWPASAANLSFTETCHFAGQAMCRGSRSLTRVWGLSRRKVGAGSKVGARFEGEQA